MEEVDVKLSLVITKDSPKSDYDSLFLKDIGFVFKVNDYETVMERIKEYTPLNKIFEVFPVTPGTALFTMYGSDHCVVTENKDA